VRFALRILVCVLALAAIGGCTNEPAVFNGTTAEAEAKVYVPEGPPKLTVFTMINNRTGAGGHSALLVSGSQQVLFDPAGSFAHPAIPERGDVHYGMTPAWVQRYKGAHARNTHHVVTQEFVVTPGQAEQALQLVQSKGSVASSFCANATSGILRQIDGFGDIDQTFYPKRLMAQLNTRPGVSTDRYYEDDDGNIRDGVAALQR